MIASTVFSFLAMVPSLVFAADCVRTYTVKDGDICDTISAANNASTYQLVTINNGSIDEQCGNLAIGQQLCLGTSGEDCQETYVVQAEDVCDSILTKFAINSTILYQNNPQIDSTCSNIYDGEVLCVANQVLAPPSSGVEIVHPSAVPASTTAAPAATSTSADDDSDDDDGDDDDDVFCDEL